MDKELQSYYEERFSMTGTQGWTDLLDDVAKMKAVVGDIRNASNGEQLAFRKGQLDILEWLENLRNQAIEAYDELKNDASL